MRIAILGGEARDLVNFRGHLISELAKAGHTVFGIAPGGSAEIQADIEKLGGSLVPVSLDRTGLNPLRDLGSLLQLYRLFRRLELDLLLAYEAKAVIFGSAAARLAGVKSRFAMITGRGSTLQEEPQGLKRKLVRSIVINLYRVALRQTRGVLFQNNDDLALFAAEGMLPARVPRIIVNGSGVDLGHFGPVPLPPGPVSFLFVGRLLRDKGIHEFVEASRSLKAAGVPASFRILGPLDSNPNALSAEHLAEWTREGTVEYLGTLKDVRPAIAAAHVLVLPSYSEGTPRSVLEAMSMGRAIVTTDAPGCRETVQDGVNGLLVPVKDSRALAEAMRRLSQDAELVARFGREGRRIAETKYDVRLVSADILSFVSTHSSPHQVSGKP
jgi:glycosyltransferase involved in cell wall biosynthesis